VSDYILTTEEVRNAFSLMEDDAATQENFQNFDRWLESTLQKTQIADGVKAAAWDKGLQGTYPNHYTVSAAEQVERDLQKRELWDNPAFHEGRLWGRMEERERIIKLLESETSLDGFAFRDSGVPLSKHIVDRIRGDSK
jgi:hypothetical protein